MKRLLACMVVVLALGVMTNVSAKTYGEGKADDNKDKKITNGELIAYLKDNVSQEAFTQNRQQDPMLAGDPDKVLLRY